jgi:hypothetical protein
MNIFPVIVVYNKSFDESRTLLHLNESNVPSSNVIVVDNSTGDYGIKTHCSGYGYNYISMNGNVGLSKAYNAALNFLNPIANPEDLVMWLDDDTGVTNDYLYKLSIQAEKDIDVDVFMPIIIGQDGVIYSPNEVRFLKSRFMTNINDKINMDQINGINSCLAVRYRVYRDYRYAEDLFMDLADNLFFDDMRRKGAKFNIIKTVIHQTFFQRGENINVDSVIKRFRIRIADLMIYSRKKGKRYLILALFKSYGWGIINGKKNNSPKLFYTCLYVGTKHFLKNIAK